MFLNNLKIVRSVIPIVVSHIKKSGAISSQYKKYSICNKTNHDFINKCLLSRNNVKSVCRLLHDDKDKELEDIIQQSSSEITDFNDHFDKFANWENSNDSEDRGMEDEITEFFGDRVISYEEVESCYLAPCPVCLKKNIARDIFIDKISGYSVCPWCTFDGIWEDLVAQYDTEDYLSEDQMDELLLSSKLITQKQLVLLNLTPFANYDIKRLTQSEARISNDEARLMFPLHNEKNEHIGFASFSLLNSKKSFKAVYQLLKGQVGIFHCKQMKEMHGKKKVIIVSKISDCIALAKSTRYAICFTRAPTMDCLQWALKDAKEIYIWVEEQLNENLVKYFKAEKECDVYLVPLHHHREELINRSSKSVKKILSETIPIFDLDVVKDYKSIQNEVFDNIKRKEEQCGVQWSRYSVLNEILHGHRAGELTIFTGLTGSGKTTFMSEYSLDLCMQGVPTLWGSFEVDHVRLIENMLQQYCGKAIPNDLFAFRSISKEFCLLPMYTLSYYGQQTIDAVLNPMAESVSANGVRHVIIDNLQFMLGVNDKSSEWWWEQDRAVGAFRNFATKFKCHVTLIVHPKKLQHGEVFGLNNISGGARVTQEADNVMILQTKLKPNSADTFAPKTLQVVKNRYGGTLGEVKLSFHKDSKTFSNYFSKNTPKRNNPYNQSTDR